MTGKDDHRTYTDDEIADIVRKGIYSFPGPSYAPFDGPPPVPFVAPRYVRIVDGGRVRAVFRLVPVYGDAEGVLVDEKADIRVRLDQIEPGNDAGAGDRVARRDRPAIATYDAEERAARHLPSLWVVYDSDRGIYQFDMRKRDGRGNLFDVRADRLAQVMWKLNEELRKHNEELLKHNECTNAFVDPDTFTVGLIRAGLSRITD